MAKVSHVQWSRVRSKVKCSNTGGLTYWACISPGSKSDGGQVSEGNVILGSYCVRECFYVWISFQVFVWVFVMFLTSVTMFINVMENNIPKDQFRSVYINKHSTPHDLKYSSCTIRVILSKLYIN